jgi:hypothetical protein
MDDEDNVRPAPRPRSAPTEVLVIRLWRPGGTAPPQTIRGHVSTLGGERIGSFDTLPQLFALLERTLA